LFVDIARSNLCETENSTNCFQNEPGVVESVDGSSEFVVTSLGGGLETVGPYNGSWDNTPAPDTRVVLERWEGNEIAYVYVPESGSRYKTPRCARPGESRRLRGDPRVPGDRDPGAHRQGAPRARGRR